MAGERSADGATEETRPIRVFISYADESDAHRDAVRQLCEFLCARGIDARLDWSDGPDRVLVIVSPAYRARCESEQDQGLRLVRDAFDRTPDRFVPVVLPGQSLVDVPDYLIQARVTVCHVRDFTDAGADDLLRLLAIPGPAVRDVTNKAGDVSGKLVQAGFVESMQINLVNGAPVATSYHQQVLRIAPASLHDRQDELAALARFCLDPATAGQYRWWRAKAWSGKSALLSWFVLNPPATVRVVSFFITARLASQNDRAAFIDNLLEQLLTLLGQPLPPLLTDTNREAHLLRLLAEAAEACQRRGESFVLVVDGLDEDRGAHAGVDWHSIAALLPVRPPSGMRVIVAGRADPPLPGDLVSGHPLRDPAIRQTLAPSPHARDLREEMTRDLDRLLDESSVGLDVLGLLVAAGGGLSVDDLATLAGCPPRRVEQLLKTVAGRSFTSRPSHFRPVTAPAVYLLAHEELDATARDQLGRTRLAYYRDRLHSWAQTYRDRGWPKDTPHYLLRGYHDMLAQTGDLARLIECGVDRDRQERLLRLSGGDAAALAELVHVMELCVQQPTPDLDALVRLARHRDRLRDRNSDISADLPALWVLLDRTSRAEVLARSITNPGEQVRALLLVAEAVRKDAEHDRGVALLHEAETTAHTIPELDERVSALQSVAEALAKTGDHGRAEELARSIANPDDQAWALRLVADAMAHSGDDGRAEVLARSITVRDEQTWALRLVAMAVARTGDVDRAEKIACGITKSDEQVRAISAVAEAMAETGEQDRARALLDRIETAARDGAESAFQLVVRAMARIGDLDRAERLARSITSPAHQAAALKSVADAAVRTGDHGLARALLDEAEETARSITNHGERTHLLESVAGAMASAGGHGQAELLARSLTDPAQRVRTLLSVAEAMLRATEDDQARTLLQEAELVARSIASPGEQAQALRLVARTVASVGDRDRAGRLLGIAESLACSIANPDEQAAALRSVAETMALVGDHDRARETACAIVDPDEQLRALRSVVRSLIDVRDYGRAAALLHDLEAISRSIAHPFGRATALWSIAVAVAEAGDRDRAMTIARCIGEPFLRAQAMVSIAETATPTATVEVGRDLRTRTVARRLLATPWYESAYDLVLLAPAALDDGIRELIT